MKQPEEMPVRRKTRQVFAGNCRNLPGHRQDRGKIADRRVFCHVVLGGDHSIAAGVAAGVSSFYRKQKKEIGYIWLDAHGDMNTPESSPSGNVHGMPLAAIMGYGAPELVDLMGFKPKAEPGNIVIVGARDLDAQERKIVKKSGMHVFTMRDIDERGMRDVMSDALKYAMDDTAGVAVSLDMDFVDPDRRPRRRYTGARRRHLSRSASRHGNDRRQRSDGVARSRRDQSHHRRTQPHRIAGR